MLLWKGVLGFVQDGAAEGEGLNAKSAQAHERSRWFVIGFVLKMDMSVYVFPHTSLDVLQNLLDKGQSCGLGRFCDICTKAQSWLSGKAIASG